MYNIAKITSANNHFLSMVAVVSIFIGFAFILFSIISFSNIIFLVTGIIFGIIFITFGFLIFFRFIRALRYYNLYISGVSSLKEISDVLMDSKNNIKKDIEKMATLNVMPNVSFDYQDNLVFKSYTKNEKAIKTSIDNEIKEDKNIKNNEKSKEIKEIKEEKDIKKSVVENPSIKKWNKYLAEIHTAEEEFKSQDISFSLFRLGKVIKKVLDYLEKHQDKEKDVKKLMDFHLPSTLKLIASYKELDVSGLNTLNIEKTKEDIASACDKIHEAFTGVLEDLYNDRAIDVSADIQVLKLLLAKEGFLDRDSFKIK